MSSSKIIRILLLLLAMTCMTLNSTNQNTSVTLSCDATNCFVITGNNYTEQLCKGVPCLLTENQTATFVLCTKDSMSFCPTGVCLNHGYRGCSNKLPYYIPQCTNPAWVSQKCAYCTSVPCDKCRLTSSSLDEYDGDQYCQSNGCQVDQIDFNLTISQCNQNLDYNGDPCSCCFENHPNQFLLCTSYSLFYASARFQNYIKTQLNFQNNNNSNQTNQTTKFQMEIFFSVMALALLLVMIV